MISQGLLAERTKNKPDGGLLHSRYDALANNTIDYWMLPDDEQMTEARLNSAVQSAAFSPLSSAQIYLHVPFCAQRCRFCAFSGGNSLDFKQGEKYSRLVIAQLLSLLEQTEARNKPIRSVNIGGGSPDLVGTHIDYVLQSVRNLPGVTEQTEISVEFTLSTVSKEFIDLLAKHNVTKASFGIQSLDRSVRHYMRQPSSVLHLEQVLQWLSGRIPVVNADLITGMPGQDLNIVLADLKTLIRDPRINAISSYLLTPGAAPAMVAALNNQEIPAMPLAQEQALMRLHTYSTLLSHGWLRRGTNTYLNPSRMGWDVLSTVAGNECIGTAHYEDFLIGAGPQAISHLPGARLENHVDIRAWTTAMEKGESPFHLKKCSDFHQRDTALWVFPLRWEGLSFERYELMVKTGSLSNAQTESFQQFQNEGLIVKDRDRFRLSIVGEVFMGRLVHDLKKTEGQQAIDSYIEEGHALGKAIADGKLRDSNAANNRQLFEISSPHLPKDD